MPPRFLLSASTILSDPARAGELFGSGQPVEFGTMRAPEDADAFAGRASGRLWGLHFPRLAATPRHLRPGDPVAPLLEDAAWARARGAAYVLAHLPYLETSSAAAEAVEPARQLAEAAAAATLPLFAELKLGRAGDPGVLALPPEVLRELVAPARLCLDLGDAFLAARALGQDVGRMVRGLAPAVGLVHVHTVRWPREDHYVWEPVHPDLQRPEYLDVEGALDALAEGGAHPDFVYEHTPHRAGPPERAREGQAWFEALVRARFTSE